MPACRVKTTVTVPGVIDWQVTPDRTAGETVTLRPLTETCAAERRLTNTAAGRIEVGGVMPVVKETESAPRSCPQMRGRRTVRVSVTGVPPAEAILIRGRAASTVAVASNTMSKVTKTARPVGRFTIPGVSVSAGCKRRNSESR